MKSKPLMSAFHARSDGGFPENRERAAGDRKTEPANPAILEPGIWPVKIRMQGRNPQEWAVGRDGRLSGEGKPHQLAPARTSRIRFRIMPRKSVQCVADAASSDRRPSARATRTTGSLRKSPRPLSRTDDTRSFPTTSRVRRSLCCGKDRSRDRECRSVPGSDTA